VGSVGEKLGQCILPVLVVEIKLKYCKGLCMNRRRLKGAPRAKCRAQHFVGRLFPLLITRNEALYEYFAWDFVQNGTLQLNSFTYFQPIRAVNLSDIYEVK